MTQDYKIENFDDEQGNPAGGIAEATGIRVEFQDGPLMRDGVRQEPNGAFVETLLAIVADRIRYYQSKKFACRENAIALTKVEEALHWLDARTKRRTAAGIEGSHGTDKTEAAAAPASN